MSHSILVPKGSDLALSEFLNAYVVIVASPPQKAEVSLLTRPGLVALLTHDAGMSWPDREGCQLASEFLAFGSPVALQFASLADAQACHERLLRSVSSSSTEARP